MKLLENIIGRAAKIKARIVLPEGEDVRIVEGAMRAQNDGLCVPILLGRLATISKHLQSLGANPADFEIIDVGSTSKLDTYAEAFFELRKHKGITLEAAREAVSDPMVFAAMMVKQREAQGTLGGAVATTAETVRAALQVIGRAPDVETVSSFFLMFMDHPQHGTQSALIFSDCGMIVEPTVDELATIAIASADSFKALLDQTARVAMLSFSTAGSAAHPRVEHTQLATAKIKSERPDIIVDGELQFDAAFVPAVSETKAPDSPLKGNANVFVFPNLEAANIGYKIAQRIGGAKAIGPILQGLASPANDLSRGCTADDVYNLIAVTVVQTTI